MKGVKNAANEDRRTSAILSVAFYFAFLVLFLFAYCLYDYLLSKGIQDINPEYTNGILTASSIIFGFWVLKLGSLPSSRKIVQARMSYFAISISLLIVTVIFMSLSAVDLTYHIKALAMAVLCFLMNIAFLCLVEFIEWSHKVEEIKKQRHHVDIPPPPPPPDM